MSQHSLFFEEDTSQRPALQRDIEVSSGAYCECQVPRPDDLSHLTKADHPAKFSEGIVKTFAQLLDFHHGCVLDPFAGTGRLRELEGMGPWCVHTIEYEPEWAMHDDLTWLGDARDLQFEDGRFPVVATSPTYGNGMGQRHHHPNNSPRGSRHSYPDKLRRDMTDGNTGAVRWGQEYRELHQDAWREVVRVLAPSGRLLLNFRDSLKKAEPEKHALQPISGWHLRTLCDLGLTYLGSAAVGTPGMGAGSNRNQLGTGEVILVFDKLHWELTKSVSPLRYPKQRKGWAVANAWDDSGLFQEISRRSSRKISAQEVARSELTGDAHPRSRDEAVGSDMRVFQVSDDEVFWARRTQ